MSYSYASNIAWCALMKRDKIFGLKSHDCHVLLECLLPLIFPRLLYKDVYDTLIELCLFFSHLCSKTLKIDILERFKAQIPIILCKIEMISLLAFFDIMI